MALLELKNLKTFFATKRGTVKAVNGVSYSLDAGKVLGVVGESGSGKSVSAMSILRLLDGNGYIDSGEILFNGQDLTKLSMNEMYKIRGNEISVIFQEPMTSLNPVFTVSRQISEPLMIHQGMNKKQAAAKAVELLSDVKIPNPEVVAKQYPHQLSGGMRQRAALLRTYLSSSGVALLDEPFSALDTLTKASVHKWYLEVMQHIDLSTLFITHDIDEAILLSDRIYILNGTPGTIKDEIVIQERKPRAADFALSEEFLEYKRRIISKL